MEITFAKEDLYSGVQAVERIVSTRSTLPIIGNVLVETSTDCVKMSANNLEMGMEISIPATIKEAGSALIPAKTLSGIVSKLPSTNVNLKKNDKGVIKISYKQSHFNINSLSPDEFPVLPKVKEVNALTINPKTFVEMAKQTMFSVSSSEDKYILNGVLLETGKTGIAGDESNIRMIATDGFRLAKRGAVLPGNVPTTSVIIPAKALSEVARMISAGDGELKISLTNEQISFRYKDSYLVSRLIQGQFPDYKQVIPKKHDAKITADTKALLEAAERASVIAGSSSNIIKVKVQDAKLHIIANTPDVGSVDEVVDVEIKGEEKNSIAFNVRLITDVLKVIDSEKVQLEFSGPLNPGTMRPVDTTDYVYIIMPIRTTESA